MLSALGALVFPALCPCGEASEPLCARCAAALVPAPSAPPPFGVDDWAAAFAYQGVVRELVARLKYRNARAALAWLATATADAAAVLDIDRAVVTWVPTTPQRRHRRGFDHAELLARAIAIRLGRPPAGLLRRLPGPPQTGRARAERRSGPRLISRSASPAPVSVLLVDDVSTTGASLTAAATTLRARGARYVQSVTIARTPDPSDR